MSEAISITVAKKLDGPYTHSMNPFDPYIQGDMIAYPTISSEQLQRLQVGTPQEVQAVLANLTNL